MTKNRNEAVPLTPTPAPPAAKEPREVRVGRQSTADMKAIGGSGFELWDTQLLWRTAAAASPQLQAGEDTAQMQGRNAGLAGLALHAFAPKDPVEAMLASQAVALHFAALECARRAMLPQQNADVASRLRKDMANLSRAMVDMAEALDRRRGKGPQVVRVERVVVNEGGQAVVGVVSPGTPSVTSGVAQQAISQGGPGDAIGDALPVIAGDVRGEGEGA